MYTEPIYARKLSKLPEFIHELLVDQDLPPDQVVSRTKIMCKSILRLIKEERSSDSEESQGAGR